MDATNTLDERKPVTVVVHRRVKPGLEAQFENTMREFIDFTLTFPGHQEIHVLRPGDTDSRDYTVVDKFSNFQARQSFKRSAQYQEWMARLRSLTEGDPDIEEMGGLAGWFTLPGHKHGGPPPKYKMALVTFLGVYPLTSVLPVWFQRLLPGWHPLLTNVLVTGLIVALLTWLIMPLLTRVFQRWLFVEPEHDH